MIHILKHGTQRVVTKFYQIVCPVCNCQFETDGTEFTMVTRCPSNVKDWHAEISCPDCKNKMSVRNTDITIREQVTEIQYHDDIYDHKDD